jgi:hypothetical protein
MSAPWWWPRCGNCGQWIAAKNWFYGKSHEEDMNLPWRCPRCRP